MRWFGLCYEMGYDRDSLIILPHEPASNDATPSDAIGQQMNERFNELIHDKNNDLAHNNAQDVKAVEGWEKVGMLAGVISLLLSIVFFFRKR